MPTDSQQTVVATDSAQDLTLFNSTLTCQNYVYQIFLTF